MIQSGLPAADLAKVTLHAFVDESRRGDQYLIAAAVVDPRYLRPLRKLLSGLRKPGQRELHFKKETPARRREIIARLVGGGASTSVYVASCAQGEARARSRCLVRLIHDLLDVQTGRLVLDSRQDRDDHDRLTIRKALGERPTDTVLVYEHFDSTAEPLLWIADAVAWCYGAGADWQRRIGPLLTKVIDLRDVR